MRIFDQAVSWSYIVSAQWLGYFPILSIMSLSIKCGTNLGLCMGGPLLPAPFKNCPLAPGSLNHILLLCPLLTNPMLPSHFKLILPAPWNPIQSLKTTLKKISGTKKAHLGSRLAVRKTGPCGAPFWCHFLFSSGTVFFLNMIIKEKTTPFLQKRSRFSTLFSVLLENLSWSFSTAFRYIELGVSQLTLQSKMLGCWKVKVLCLGCISLVPWSQLFLLFKVFRMY